MVLRGGTFARFVSCTAAAGVVGSGLPGCGFVPEVAPIFSHDARKALIVAVIRGVQWEIRNAIKEQMAKPQPNS